MLDRQELHRQEDVVDVRERLEAGEVALGGGGGEDIGEAEDLAGADLGGDLLQAGELAAGTDGLEEGVQLARGDVVAAQVVPDDEDEVARVALEPLDLLGDGAVVLGEDVGDGVELGGHVDGYEP